MTLYTIDTFFPNAAYPVYTVILHMVNIFAYSSDMDYFAAVLNITVT